MPNMSYCRFENTYADLKDCYENWEDADSDTEIMYRHKILELALSIVEEYSEPNYDE